MTLEPEKFKLIPSSFKGNNFEKIQYDGKDLIQKLKGDFVITKYGQRLQLILKSVDYEIFDRIHRLAGKENITCFGGIGISINNFLMSSTKEWIKANVSMKTEKSRCVVVFWRVFHHFQKTVCFSTFMQSKSK